MKFHIIGLFFLLLLIIKCQSGSSEIIPLKLVKALPVEYSESVEPSGLTFYNGDFYTLSDDHDSIIFKLEMLEDKVVLHPHIIFEAPSLKGVDKFDFEGITCDTDGNFYLSSENAFRILKVSHDGQKVTWLFDSLKQLGEEKGLFQVPNASLEGIALINPDQFVLCAERQPRAIIKANLKGSPQIQIYYPKKTKLDLLVAHFPDFTGLFIENKNIYVLERAECVISRVNFEGDSVALSRRWTYKSIETSDEYRYADTVFTSGEGLWMDSNYIYVILDNNRNSRFSNPEDRRPLLLIMNRP